MPDVVIFKDEFGKLAGHGEKGGRAFARFQSAVRNMAVGETMAFSFKLPRSPGFHRRFFAKLGRLFDMQEQFESSDALRAWLTVGAGECQFVPGPTGRMVALPKSISWERMDEAEFSELVGRIDSFLWTDHAQRFLWPHLTRDQSEQMIESLSIEFS